MSTVYVTERIKTLAKKYTSKKKKEKSLKMRKRCRDGMPKNNTNKGGYKVKVL